MTPASPANSLPGLDADGERLHRDVLDRSQKEGVDYFTALVKVTGNEELRGHGDVPPRAPDLASLVPEGQPDEDLQVRTLMRTWGVGYFDAAELLDRMEALNAPEREPKAPWLDPRPLAEPPRPWSEEDWERDRRRASAAGFELNRELWAAAAGQGRDLVGEEHEASEDTATRRAEHEEFVREAQHTEAARRGKAIKDELERRAKERLRDAERRTMAARFGR